MFTVLLMKSVVVHSLTENFEDHAQKTESGVEFWLTRDLQRLLGYSEWDVRPFCRRRENDQTGIWQ